MKASDWDDFASAWDSNEDVRAYAVEAFSALRKKVVPLLPQLNSGRVLDFGCGTGLLSRQLVPLCREVVAVDSSAKMIAELDGKNAAAGIRNIVSLNVDIDAAEIDRRPALNAGFDLIVASSVCSFLPNYEKTLCDLASVLNAGGCFVQWDWIADMPVDRVSLAFSGAGLHSISIEQAFAMQDENGSMPVVMGIAQSP